MRQRVAALGWPLLVAATWTMLLYLMLPTLVAVPVSLTANRYLSLPEHGELSVRHYSTFFTDPIWQSAILQSLAIGAAATVLATALGGLAAIGLWRAASRLAESVRLIALAPLIVPPLVSALAFYRLFAAWGLLDTIPGVVIAHALLATPYVLITVAASLANIDLRQEQASRSLGASGAQTIRYVILPQIVPGLATGAVFAFLTSWDEIIVTLFIAVREVYTLPRKMWDGINENLEPTIAAAATILFVVTIALVGWQALRAPREV
jgi:putative spermidine/putrescine transport system permease protein